MTKNFKLRLAGLALAIVIVALMIGWAAHAGWRQYDQLSRQLTEMQIESFQTADQFRANLQELDFVLLRYTIRQDTADRDRFLKEWKKMDDWIDIQRPHLTTDKEGKILDQINAAYDDYFAAATNLLQQAVQNAADDRTLTAFRKIEEESGRLLGLGYQLVNAHRESLTQFLADSQGHGRHRQGNRSPGTDRQRRSPIRPPAGARSGSPGSGHTPARGRRADGTPVGEKRD